MIDLINGLETIEAFLEEKTNFQHFTGVLIDTCLQLVNDKESLCYIVMARQFPESGQAQPEMQYYVFATNEKAQAIREKLGVFHAGSIRSGIAGRVLSNPAEPIFVPDTSSNTGHMLHEVDVCSQLGVAIVYKSICYGAIILESYQPDGIPESAIRAVQVLAKQSAIAISLRPRKHNLAKKIKAKLQGDQLSDLIESLNEQILMSSDPIHLFQTELSARLSSLASLVQSQDWFFLELTEDSDNETRFDVINSSFPDTIGHPIIIPGVISKKLADDVVDTPLDTVAGLEQYIDDPDTGVFLISIQSVFDETAHLIVFVESNRNTRSAMMDVEQMLKEIHIRLNGSYNIAKYKYAQVIYDEDRNIFMQDVMHQLNTAMGSILIDTENLIDDDIPPEGYKEAFNRLYELANMARSYTDTVSIAVKSRTLFEMYNQEFTVHTGSQLEDILEKVAYYFRGKCQAYQIDGPRIDKDSFMELPPVKIHRELFELAMFNFIDNAVKYSFRLDRVSTKSSSLPDSVPVDIVASVTPDKQYIDIGVTNHGIPLTSDDIKMIFKRLQRSESAKQHEQKGTGIGLYICHEIAKVHNGGIVVKESEPSEIILGDKVTFTLRLPVFKS